MTESSYPRAACLLIGDELLSGRTRDANSHHLARVLHDRGLELIEIRVVPDEMPAIVSSLRELKDKAEIVFTSGGIGPTHDDITADAVAEALGRPIAVREDALEILKHHYAKRGEEVTDARRRMARVPEGAELIPNAITGAPGFVVDNVYVMAGVPAIFEAMLDAVKDRLPTGPEETAFSVIGELGESSIADGLRDLQTALKGLKIGSYPGPTGRGGDLVIVCRSQNPATAEQAALAVKALFAAQGGDARIEEGQLRQSLNSN
ncbi:competence/damage-inducible protein A [Parvularcula lutaonensis]|uniref:Competence/damage-inducible protein A n=1 Tax=Parvularcula lutaonensis TaxID=491923 RepID=A0ABV7MDL2_9PROT|nr:molybdopterin-binding protein [Parvularcula lutaonensis]GGY40117.1 molybdenum cofactor biosynthesis protein [Parvularcula lutaonensis]